MTDLTIYILTHNRGEMLLETIYSVLNQDCKDFNIVVSDNSSNNKTFELLKNNGILDKLDYRKRDKEYTSFDHFNLCLNEVKTKYFMLFHDDDLMMAEMVSTLYQIINNSEFIAVGCNGKYLYDNVKSNKRFFHCNGKGKTLTIEGLSESYAKCKISAFPSYMYNREKIGDLHFIPDVGKYSDVTWLLRLCGIGNLYWVKKPLMYYRIHSNQDSSGIDYLNELKLIRKLSENIVNKKTVTKLRVRYLYDYETLRKKHYRNLGLYRKYSPLFLYPRTIYKILFSKITVNKF